VSLFLKGPRPAVAGLCHPALRPSCRSTPLDRIAPPSSRCGLTTSQRRARDTAVRKNGPGLLLRHPGGFEGFGPALVGAEGSHHPIPNRVDAGDSHVDLGAATSTAPLDRATTRTRWLPRSVNSSGLTRKPSIPSSAFAQNLSIASRLAICPPGRRESNPSTYADPPGEPRAGAAPLSPARDQRPPGWRSPTRFATAVVDGRWPAPGEVAPRPS
jgi:hypothetical protein